MSRTRASRTSPDDARIGRRDESCARAAGPETGDCHAPVRVRPPWFGSYWQARDEITLAERRLDRNRRAVDECERLISRGRVNPRRPRSFSLIANVHDRLTGAAFDLDRVQGLLRHTSEHAQASTELREGSNLLYTGLLHNARRLGARTAMLAARAEALMAAFSVCTAGFRLPTEPAPVPESATVRRGRAIAAAIPVPPPRHRRLLGNAHTVARRVCRGRAPPALSVRSL